MTQFVNYVSNYIHKHELYDKIKKGSTYQEVYDEVILSHNDVLRSRDEYSEIAQKIMNVIEEQHGRHLLRVYCYYPYIKTTGYHGFDYHDLYEELIKQVHNQTIKPILMFENIVEDDDKFMIEDTLKAEFDKKYGFIRPSLELDNMLHLMRRNLNNKEYMKFLEVDCKRLLQRQQDKYFIKQDLTDKEVFLELYKVVGEQMGFTEYRFSVFYTYDGYGEIVPTFCGEIE